MSYYAIYIATTTRDENEKGYVFTDIDKALKVLKTHKPAARLKTFKNYREAEEFSYTGFGTFPIISKTGLKSPSAISAEKSPFRAPTKQELIQFRKAIEEDKYDLVEKTIWDNPRYLVNMGDTPTSLKDGARYNALHVCAIHKRPRIAELILQTISKVYFIELLHGKKNEKVCQEVRDILLDYYLNMPEKGRSETPLHLATKFGAAEMVQVLTTYPQCKMTPNLDNMLPKDIICARMGTVDEELKEKITKMLDERFYVPVIRSVDNSLPPVIGEPFSATNLPELNKDPLSPECEIQAIAGPMTKEHAQNFRRRWKTPPRVSNSNSTNSLYISPVKTRCSSTPQQLPPYNNNSSPLSSQHHTGISLFPNKSIKLDSEDDTTNGNYEIKKQSSTEECVNNNSRLENHWSMFNLNTPMRAQRKDLFLTYREQVASPLDYISSPGTPLRSTNSALLENDLYTDSPLKVRHMKLSDTEKGLEVIGRSLAKEHHIDWKEYWDFLDCFIDISSAEGLTKLDNYLKNRKEPEGMKTKNQNNDTTFNDICSALKNIVLQKNDTNTPNSQCNTNWSAQHSNLSTISNKAGYISQATAPYLCVEKSVQVFARRMTKTISNNLKSVASIHDAFNTELNRLRSLICSFRDDKRFLEINFNSVHSRFANLILAYLKCADNIDSSAMNKIQECFQQIIQTQLHLNNGPRVQHDKKEQLQCVSEFILEYLESSDNKILPENMKTEKICLEVWQEEQTCFCLWESDCNRQLNRKKRLEVIDAMVNECKKRNEINMDSEIDMENEIDDNQAIEENNDVCENIEDSSSENSDLEDDEETFWSDVGSEKSDNFYTPPESPSLLEMNFYEDDDSYKCYLLGDEPTKRDLDVINALYNTEIDREIYPHIHRWRAAVLRHSLDERDNFPSPSVVIKRRTNSNNTNDRLGLARRLFSSPHRSSSHSLKLNDSTGNFFYNYRQNNLGGNNSSLNESSSMSRANLSLSFMNVSDI